MRIALTFPGCHRRAGVERVVYEAARFLGSRDHDVTVLTSDWEPIADPNVTFHEVRLPNRMPGVARHVAFGLRAAHQLDTSEFDVVGTHGCVSPTGGVLWIQSVHRAWLARSRTFRVPWSTAWLRQRLNPAHPILLAAERYHLAKRRYQRVIAATEHVRDDLHELYGVPEEDVVLIPNGFSPQEFNPQRRAERRDAMRASLGLAPDDIALLFVGHELERKGYRTVLAAMRQLADPAVRLLLVGDVNQAAARSIAADHGLQDAVSLCGPTPDVAAFHAAADLFVLPTQYEAYCLAILEALASGLPVITTRVPGAMDAIEPGTNGLLVDDPLSGQETAEALEALLDPVVRERFSRRAPATVERYRWSSVLPRYESTLLDVARTS